MTFLTEVAIGEGKTWECHIRDKRRTHILMFVSLYYLRFSMSMPYFYLLKVNEVKATKTEKNSI